MAVMVELFVESEMSVYERGVPRIPGKIRGCPDIENLKEMSTY